MFEKLVFKTSPHRTQKLAALAGFRVFLKLALIPCLRFVQSERMIEAVKKSVMQHPVFYLARLTKFLDELIQEQGVYLFAGLVVVCALVLAWIFTRRC